MLDLKTVRAMYNLPGRYYHNWDHIQYLLSLSQRYWPAIVESNCDYETILLAIIFHDIIYVPGSNRNEVLSAEFFHSVLKDASTNQAKQAIDAILNTEYMSPLVKLEPLTGEYPTSYWLQSFDLYQLITEDRPAQLFNFCMVWEEFGKLAEYNKELFARKQNDFLRALAEKYNFNFNRDITWEEIEAEKDKPLTLEDQ